MTASLALPALHASHAGTWLRDGDRRTRGVGKGEAVMAAADTPLLLLNAPLVANRLGYPDLSGLDLLELFAFVHPARFAVPTPKGLAHALGHATSPRATTRCPRCCSAPPGALLAVCESDDWPEREGAWSTLQSLLRLRWPWAQVLAAARRASPSAPRRWLFARLPEWEETPERPQPAQVLIEEPEIEARLARLTGEGAERREGQRSYARDAGGVFAPRARRGVPHVLLAQAGTGIGKTLGYLAPASLWAEKSGGTVWVATFTKNLQRQLRRESGARVARRARRRQPPGGGAQGARELPLPAQSGRCAAGRVRRARGDPGAAGRALGGLFAGRRHDRRRPARLARHAVPQARRSRR